MDKRNTNNSTRGRPPIGSTRMVTIGVRVEPEERERLEALASERGLSLCAYLRELARRELHRAESAAESSAAPAEKGPPLRACN